MNEDKTFKKVTEGEGYISGDMECWCINPLTFREMVEFPTITNEEFEIYEKLDESRVYPSDFVPLEFDDVVQRNQGRKPKVRYKVTFEIEILDEEWEE